MTSITIELPDDILEAVRIEAEHFGTTPEQRIERLIEQTHRQRVKHPRAQMDTELERLIESGEAKPLREYLPTTSDKIA